MALRLGTTVSAVKSEVHRLRLRYGQYLRAEIAATVTDPAEVDAEIRHLLALFARPPPSLPRNLTPRFRFYQVAPELPPRLPP